MADDEISESGIWLDEDGKVVEKAPRNGTQLVRPGGRVTAYAQARIDQANAGPSGFTSDPPPEEKPKAKKASK